MITERQRKFVEHYAATGNAAEAARLAGYSAASARSIGNRLLTKAYIKTAIQDLTGKSSAERIADADEIRGFWTSVMRDEDARTADRLTASVSLAKTAGLFPTKIQVKDDRDDKPDVIIYLPEIEKDEDE